MNLTKYIQNLLSRLEDREDVTCDEESESRALAGQKVQQQGFLYSSKNVSCFRYQSLSLHCYVLLQLKKGTRSS